MTLTDSQRSLIWQSLYNTLGEYRRVQERSPGLGVIMQTEIGKVTDMLVLFNGSGPVTVTKE